jgi:hypothetical protein
MARYAAGFPAGRTEPAPDAGVLTARQNPGVFFRPPGYADPTLGR